MEREQEERVLPRLGGGDRPPLRLEARISVERGAGGAAEGEAPTATRAESTAPSMLRPLAGMKSVIAPRISGDLKRPEIVIKPRLDLAANLGVTTAALSNAIRIATLGDIDQNSARFSLSDRQIPIRVALDESARERLSTIQNLPVQTASGGSVPLRVEPAGFSIARSSPPTLIRPLR